jgi:hypothetical protein
MKRIFLNLIVTVLTLSVHAEEAKLLVWQADGQVVTFDLDEEPVTTYSDGNLVITTTSKTVTYPLEQVRKYTYFLPKARLLGDANGNGELDNDDIIEVSNNIMGMPSKIKFVFENSDVNGDGKVNAIDLVMIISSIKNLNK